VSGVRQDTNSKGTAVKKRARFSPWATTALPERVTVAMAEIAESMQEGLLALAVGAGLQVMQALMDADVTTLAGPKGRHDQGRTAVRHGRERGSVTLGGRRVAVSRPRVRAADGSGELPIASYELFTSTEILGKMALEKMLAGLSTRRYPVGLEPVGRQSLKHLLRQASRRSPAALWR
jgi:putative transposase